MKEKNNISRRSFLKAAGAATALGAAGALMIAGKDGNLLAEGELSGTRPAEEVWKHTTCWIGKQDCGMLARIENGRIVKFEGDPANPRNDGKLCPKGLAQIMAVYDPYRVKKPLRRTNAKGITGEWEEITWDEALTETAAKINEAIDSDPAKFLWQKGRSKSEAFYDNSFIAATTTAKGAPAKMGHGAYCSDAGYRALEYTYGPHGVLHPDFKYTKYLISWGWNAIAGGGNKTCWITWPRQFLDARERGLKVVSIDPRKEGMGQHTDEWLPIKPATDLAFFLAMANVLIEKGFIDKNYLTNYTNSPFLIQESDGRYLKAGGKEQVWDTTSASAKDHDAADIKPELDGAYTVGGVAVKTGYRLLKEHVASATPEWAADICGLTAESIRRVAEEFGQNSMIGSTTIVDGVELPYRPAAIMGYHVTQQELGFQACRMATMVAMLTGSIEAVGGTRSDYNWAEYKYFSKFETLKVKDGPYNLYLDASKFYPINTPNPGVAALAMLNPDKYGLPKEKIPTVCLIHMANPLCSFLDRPVLIEAYKLYKFVCVIDPWLSETADYFADIILPAATIEKYEGVISASHQYRSASTLRLPPIDPLFESRGDIDIYLDLCEKMGPAVLAKYIDRVNSDLALKGTANEIPNTSKPAVRDIFDRWAKEKVTKDMAGLAEEEKGIAYFEKYGVQDKGAVSAKKIYGFAQTPKFKAMDKASTDAGLTWIRARLYGESLHRIKGEMKAKGAGEIYYQDYTAFPTWRVPTMHGSPAEYDLTLISYKRIEFKQSRSTFIPMLAEMAPEQKVDMNPEAARDRGIEDGDAVWIESHNAVTGVTRKIEAVARYVSGLRPDTVGMSHHYGMWTHPQSKGHGPTPNELFFTGEGYVTCTADQSYHVKVKVSKK